ncbi:MAG: phage tail protein [Burkholderiaceae bacterium]|nr:MAG: phage tail protein [Burkholderiaceae bacterium]
MSEPFIGEIVLFAGSFPPRGWAFCQGQILSIAQNTALFSILGTTYGGNGQTTFGLPDLRGRVPMGTGQGPGLDPVVLGEIQGTNNVTLTTANLPAHVHSTPGAPATTAVGTLQNPAAGAVLAGSNQRNAQYASGGSNVNLASGGSTGPAGSNIPVPIVQPSLGLNYIIAIQGIFPSRN